MELPPCLGELEKQQSVATVKALTYANLDVISIADLASLLRLFPQMELAFRSKLKLTYNLTRNVSIS